MLPMTVLRRFDCVLKTASPYEMLRKEKARFVLERLR